jgi:thiosulfate/3-mercaptopyruvate sulfurtransferase
MIRQKTKTVLAIGAGFALGVFAIAFTLASASGKAANPKAIPGSATPAMPQATEAVPGAGKAAELPSSVQMEPDALAKLLKESKGQKPLVLHVGFKNFYDQAHIPGSDYVGPDSRPEGLEALRKRVASLPHSELIVLYCGCCPWDKCPNAKPAYEALHAMGFTNVKVVHIAENFGANWVNAGLPTTKGQ